MPTALTLPGPEELNEPPTDILAYCMAIYGEKGWGKTSLASQFPNAIVAMLETRRRNLKIRQVDIPVKAKERDEQVWEVLEGFIKAAIKDKTVETVVIDTIDKAYSACLAYNCWLKGIKDPSDLNDYGATWRAIKDQFAETLNRVLYAGKGLVLVSHAHYKELELRTEEKREILCPTCMPAAFQYMKEVADYAFYLGYHQKKRAMYLRGHEDLWCACGTSEHFCDPEGKPLSTILMGENPKIAFQTLVDAFSNKVWDVNAPEDRPKAKIQEPYPVKPVKPDPGEGQPRKKLKATS